MLNRKRIVAKVIGAAACGTLIAVAVVWLVRHSGGAIRLAPRPAGRPAASAIEAGLLPSDQEIRLAVPREPDNPDAGVAAAARQFAILFVTPNLTTPASAEFPEDTIRFERLPSLSQATGGKIAHWLVNGAVDSKNDYGVTVRTHWRMILGRAEDIFFPVMVSLDGREVYHRRDYVKVLAGARLSAEQELQTQAAARKAKEVAADRAGWKAADEAKPEEEKAAAALKLAVSLLTAGRKEPAHKRLEELIDKFPGTKAAAEAAELLKQ
jgi:hypothetical protein